MDTFTVNCPTRLQLGYGLSEKADIGLRTEVATLGDSRAYMSSRVEVPHAQWPGSAWSANYAVSSLAQSSVVSSHFTNYKETLTMATGSSIVGTWNTFVDWGCTGNPIVALPLTFNANGTWTYSFGGGRWIQVEGMCFFNFTNAAGLVYTANVTKNALVGIMGFAVSGPSSGCWWGTKPGAPHALAAAAVEAAAAPAAEQQDPMLGPSKK